MTPVTANDDWTAGRGEGGREIPLLMRQQFSIMPANAGLTTAGIGGVLVGTAATDSATAPLVPVTKITAAAAAGSSGVARTSTSTPIAWTDRPRCAFRFLPYNLGAGNRYWIGWFSSSVIAIGDAQAIRTVALRCGPSDATWKFVTNDGTTQANLDTGVVVTTNPWEAFIDLSVVGVASVTLWEYTGGLWVRRGLFSTTSHVPVSVSTQITAVVWVDDDNAGSSPTIGFGRLAGFIGNYNVS